jgi:hypothetical protein
VWKIHFDCSWNSNLNSRRLSMNWKLNVRWMMSKSSIKMRFFIYWFDVLISYLILQI